MSGDFFEDDEYRDECAHDETEQFYVNGLFYVDRCEQCAGFVVGWYARDDADEQHREITERDATKEEVELIRWALVLQE